MVTSKGWPAPSTRHYARARGTNTVDLLEEAKRTQEQRKPILTNLALLAPITLAAFCAIRVVSVAHGDVQIAYTIVANTTIATIGLAAFAGLLPGALPVLAVEIIKAVFDGTDAKTRSSARTALLYVSIASLLLAPRVSLIIIGLALMTFGGPKAYKWLRSFLRPSRGSSAVPEREHGGIPVDEWARLDPGDRELERIIHEMRGIPEARFPSRHFQEKRESLHEQYAKRWVELEDARKAEPNRLLTAGQSAAAIVIVSAVLNSGLWLPTENVTFGLRPETVTAYVIKQDAAWTTLLVEDRPRRLEAVRTPDIRTRDFCDQAGSWKSWTLPLLVVADGKLPRCVQSVPASPPMTPSTTPPAVPPLLPPPSSQASAPPALPPTFAPTQTPTGR